MNRLFFYILLVGFFTGCKNDPKEPVETTKTLSFTSNSIEKTANNCKPENGDCTFISLVYPVAENGKNQAQAINQVIENQLIKTIDFQEEATAEKPEELAENFIKNFKTTAQEFPEYEIPWEATVSAKVIFHSNILISIKFDSNIFTGGAHGYSSVAFLNFNTENGALLENADLFTKDFKDFVEKDFRKKQNIAADTNINSTGMFFKDDRFHLPNNIGITKDKIILHYNAYEIAPYASGNFILQYPKAQVEQYLKNGNTKNEV